MSQVDTMKAAIVTKFGAIDDVVRISTDFPRPTLVTGSNKMLIKVMACSTSPGISLFTTEWDREYYIYIHIIKIVQRTNFAHILFLFIFDKHEHII